MNARAYGFGTRTPVLTAFHESTPRYPPQTSACTPCAHGFPSRISSVLPQGPTPEGTQTSLTSAPAKQPCLAIVRSPGQKPRMGFRSRSSCASLLFTFGWGRAVRHLERASRRRWQVACLFRFPRGRPVRSTESLVIRTGLPRDPGNKHRHWPLLRVKTFMCFI